MRTIDIGGYDHEGTTLCRRKRSGKVEGEEEVNGTKTMVVVEWTEDKIVKCH